jgi:hypothetical protein
LAAALSVCLFLFGTAWLDGAFEGYHVPPMVAEYRKPDAAAPTLNDGEQPVIKLTVPQLPFMPRHITAGFNQYEEQPPSFVRGPTSASFNRYGTVWLPSPPAPRLGI